MNCVGHINPGCLKDPRHLTQGVLSLGYSKAITGTITTACGLEGEGTFSTLQLVMLVFTTATTGCGCGAKSTTEQHRHQRSVHAVAHHLREIRPAARPSLQPR